jgi:hypothetical protein
MKRSPQPLAILKGYINKAYYNSFFDEYLYSLVNRVRLWKAIRLADGLRKSTGKEYYVMNGGSKGLIVFNSLQRKALVKMKILSDNAGHLEVIQMASYYTGWGRVTREQKAQMEYNRLKTYMEKKK